MKKYNTYNSIKTDAPWKKVSEIQRWTVAVLSFRTRVDRVKLKNEYKYVNIFETFLLYGRP